MSARADERPAYPVALAGVLWTVWMLFAAFTAALLMRRGGADWQRMPLPSILWVNTGVLLASSLTLEYGRRRWARLGEPHLRRWLGAASLLGALFLAGQVLAWTQLAANGVLLPTGPHPAFFYMLSAVHGLHVVGGVGALAWVLRAAPGKEPGWGPVKHVAIYWHFVGVVWLWLLAALSLL